MKKSIIITIWLLVFAGLISVQADDIITLHNENGQLHSPDTYEPAVVSWFDYGDVRLIREEYHTNGKLNRIGQPAVVYMSLKYKFYGDLIPGYQSLAKIYYKEWWLVGKKYTKAEYDKQLHKER